MQKIFPLLLAISMLNYSVSACATVNNNLDENYNKIVLKEIELSRFNLLFNYENNKQSNWLPYRYFAGQETAAAGLNAGLIVGLMAREQHLNNPAKIHPVTLEYSLMPQMIGQFIGGAEPAYELFLKSKKYYNLKSKKIIPSLAIKHVNNLNNELNSLYIESNLKNINPIQKQELKVQKSLQQALLSQYNQFHLQTKTFNTFQNSFFVMDSLKNTVGALGNMIGIIATHDRNPKLNGPAFLLTTISGSLIVLAPVVNRINRAIVQTSIQKQLHGSNIISYQNNITYFNDNLNILINMPINYQNDSQDIKALNVRINFYKQLKDVLQGDLNKIAKQKEMNKNLTKWQIPVATVIGSTKIALGVCGMLAGFKFYNRPREAQTLVADGSIPYICGTGIALVDNLRFLTTSQIDYFKNKKINNLPGQTYSNYLDNLEKIEISVKANIKAN